MIKALVFSVFCVFALIGMRCLFDKINSKFFVKTKASATVLLNVKKEGENAELAIRNASEQIKQIKSPLKVSLCVVNNSLDDNTRGICEKTVRTLGDAFMANENAQIKTVI